MTSHLDRVFPLRLVHALDGTRLWIDTTKGGPGVGVWRFRRLHTSVTGAAQQIEEYVACFVREWIPCNKQFGEGLNASSVLT